MRCDWDVRICEAAAFEADELIDLAAHEGGIPTESLDEALRRIRGFEARRRRAARGTRRRWPRRVGRTA